MLRDFVQLFVALFSPLYAAFPWQFHATSLVHSCCLCFNPSSDYIIRLCVPYHPGLCVFRRSFLAFILFLSVVSFGYFCFVGPWSMLSSIYLFDVEKLHCTVHRSSVGLVNCSHSWYCHVLFSSNNIECDCTWFVHKPPSSFADTHTQTTKQMPIYSNNIRRLYDANGKIPTKNVHQPDPITSGSYRIQFTWNIFILLAAAWSPLSW